MGFNQQIPPLAPQGDGLPSILRLALDQFWLENPILHEILIKSRTYEEARDRLYNYISDFERKSLHGRFYKSPQERTLGRRALNSLKNLFARRNEEITGHSVLTILFELARDETPPVTMAFLDELQRMLMAVRGQTCLYQADGPKNEEVGHLDALARHAQSHIDRFPHGLQPAIQQIREANQQRIMNYFNATEEQWNDWQWQCRHVIRDAEVLEHLITLTPKERSTIDLAIQNRIMFGITPYYVSLMDFEPDRALDHAVRAQVIPPMSYVQGVIEARQTPNVSFDFMGESFTSPAPLTTRRYPMIAILKPFNTCAQICVYCQRNWEINDVLAQNAKAPRTKLQESLRWFAAHPEVDEILITGGDPAILSDQALAQILEDVCQLPQIKRIRVGTRTPVVLPMRLTEAFADLLASCRIPGKREVAVMTHFEHPYEVTPEAMEGIQRLRQRGISVYNQGVFTTENARRFEMVALRRILRLIGVSPYYTFNTKGKEETTAYRVPIARLLQEQAEEARLTPGLDRTDEAVFNIPRLGKNYLRAGQDHELIMLTPQGNRIYEFFPWDHQDPENYPFLYTDVPIRDFLVELTRRGEKIEDYESIWYYY